jgi:hypothetical protein
MKELRTPFRQKSLMVPKMPGAVGHQFGRSRACSLRIDAHLCADLRLWPCRSPSGGAFPGLGP